MANIYTIIPGTRHFNTQSTSYSNDFLIRDKWLYDATTKKFKYFNDACRFIAKNKAKFDFKYDSTKYTSTAFGVLIICNGRKYAFVYKPKTSLIVEEFGSKDWDTVYYHLTADGWLHEIED